VPVALKGFKLGLLTGADGGIFQLGAEAVRSISSISG
jgi:hypothetical protein